jgi:signal transduction histidine kinase
MSMLRSAEPPRTATPLRRAETAAREAAAPRPARLSKDVAAVVAAAVSYYLGTRIGFVLTTGDMPIATFWPPNAILLAALLLAPVRLWWLIVLALVPAHFTEQLHNGVPMATAIGWFAGNVGEALLGAGLIAMFGGRKGLFETGHGVSRFLVFAFLAAPLITSFLDAAIVVGTNWGQGYWNLWTSRLLSNMLAQLTIVPVVVSVGEGGLAWLRDRTNRFWIEAALLAVAVVAISLVVFRSESLSSANLPALIYLPLPLLLWAAMRFGPGGLSASMLLISVVSIHSMMHGHGPFISPSPATGVLSMQLFLCMVGVPLVLLSAVTLDRRRTETSLRETSHKLIDAQERERQRIARELHDNIGQTLTLAEIELDRIITNPGDRARADGLGRLRDQMTMISQAIWEISHGLYPSNLEYLGLVTALNRLCSDLRDETRLQVECATDGTPDRLPPDISLCLYRVAQEALQNVVRHSGAASVSLQLHPHRGRLILEVVDNGGGFEVSNVGGGGLGFASMRERLNAVNGGFDVQSQIGRGTRVEAWVALRAEVREARLAVAGYPTAGSA